MMMGHSGLLAAAGTSYPPAGTKAGQLDGVNDYLDGPVTTVDPATGYGFSGWAQLAKVTGDQVIVHVRQSSSIQTAIYVTADKVTAYVQRTAMIQATSASLLTVGTWFHFAFSVDVYSGSNRVRVWLNGTLVATATGTLAAGTISGGSGIGRVDNAATWFLYGKLSDLVWWSVSLTDANVLAMYNGGARTNQEAASGLTAARYWPFKSTDSMAGGSGTIADIKGGASLAAIGTVAGDLVDGPP